jgi:hypothetical protein
MASVRRPMVPATSGCCQFSTPSLMPNNRPTTRPVLRSVRTSSPAGAGQSPKTGSMGLSGVEIAGPSGAALVAPDSAVKGAGTKIPGGAWLEVAGAVGGGSSNSAHVAPPHMTAIAIPDRRRCGP